MPSFRSIAVTAALALCFTSVATADDTAPVFLEPAQIGPFQLGASATVTSEYTDNVLSTENDREGDFVTVVAPELTLQARTEDFKLDLGASAEIGFFASETSEDYTDAKLSAEGQWNLSAETFLFGGIDHAWEHEERSSADDVNGVEPTEYRESSAFAGISADLRPVSTRLGVNFRNFNFDDTPASLGMSVNNDDRDRLQTEIGSRIGYKLGEDQQVFLQGVFDMRDYDSSQDDSGFDRDSSGFNAAAGFRGQIGPFEGEALVGILHQSYDDSAFDNVTAPDFGAELTWRPDPLTRVNLALDRRLEETTLVGSSGYLADSVVLRTNRWIARDLRATGYLAYSQNDYLEIGRTDYITEAGLGMRYYLAPNIYLGGGYSFEQRTSDVAGADYDTHTTYLRLGTALKPAYRQNEGLAETGAKGFYTGVQIGDGLLKTSIDGPRGGGGSLVAEFGDFGLSGGAFAGYRAEIGSLVVGAEIDDGISAADWWHRGNRDFSVEAGNSFGASGLMGVHIQNDILLYGRVGVIGTEFETRYARGGERSTRDEREIGLHFGLGAEFPLIASLSGRMQYSLIAYPDYNLGASAGGDEDNFNSIANVANFGLLYHFGVREMADPAPVDFGGFYVGAQVGHGALASNNSGPREEPKQPFVLDADRAGMGATGGILAGYGQTFGPFYLGAEVEAELSNVNWDIERDPNGRVFSVEKRGSVGASVRAGYVVNSAVLIYSRAGLVNSWFDTDYSFGANSVERSDSELGWRVGGGIEFAASEKWRMRLDYTRTDYGSYKVDYGAGIDSLDNTENLFRIGVTHAL